MNIKGGNDMLKLAHVKEVDQLHGVLPTEILVEVERMAEFLDENYGEDRIIDTDFGGYILILQSLEDLEQLKDIYLEAETLVPEYCELIKTEYEDYTNSLIILNSEYSVSLFMPRKLTPANLLAYMEEVKE